MAAAYASQTTNQKVFESIPGRSRRGRGESDADGPVRRVVDVWPEVVVEGELHCLAKNEPVACC